MKITGTTDLTPIFSFKASLNPSPDPDLLHKRKPPRRKTKSPSFSGVGVRLRREAGAPSGKRSRPETPLLRWKFDDGANGSVSTKEEKPRTPAQPDCGQRVNRKVRSAVSVRKLAAGLWRLQLPEVHVNGHKFQSGVGQVRNSIHGHHGSKVHGSHGRESIHRPHSISGPRSEFLYELEPPLRLSSSAMEGATKWDPVCWRTSDEIKQIYGHSKLLDHRKSTVRMISALKLELQQAQARIHELETERRSSKKKIEQFLQKLSEERAMWRSREHEKIRAVVGDVKADLSRERKSRQRMEMVNSKLVNELADAKLSAKRYMQDYEKEWKARELIEEVCDELAKEIGEDKAEVEALKRESMKLREEVEEERRMLQMAEVWREERVQMKLIDAKVSLEQRYSQMNKLVAELETFLKSRTGTTDAEEVRKAEHLCHAAASINVQDIKEFTYEPPNAGDIFSVFEEVNCRESNEREIEQCVAYSPSSYASKIHTVSPEVNLFHKDSIQKLSYAYDGQNGDIDEEGSGWETVSQIEDQGSSYSPDGSDPFVNKICHDSNVSGSRTDWEDNPGEATPITEISEVCSVPAAQVKKVSSIARLWKSCPGNGENYKIVSVEGVNGRLSNGRLSNVTPKSPDKNSGKGGLSPPDLVGHWSSPDSGNPHITRGMKGCIEWPRGALKTSFKAKLLEARMESQKIQLRHVLKHKI